MILNNKIKSVDTVFPEFPCYKLGEIVETVIEDDGVDKILYEFKSLKRVPHIDQSLSADIFSIKNMQAAGIPLGKEVGSYIPESVSAQVRALDHAVAHLHEQKAAASAELNTNV